jgi:hypothetical protein
MCLLYELSYRRADHAQPPWPLQRNLAAPRHEHYGFTAVRRYDLVPTDVEDARDANSPSARGPRLGRSCHGARFLQQDQRSRLSAIRLCRRHHAGGGRYRIGGRVGSRRRVGLRRFTVMADDRTDTAAPSPSFVGDGDVGAAGSAVIVSGAEQSRGRRLGLWIASPTARKKQSGAGILPASGRDARSTEEVSSRAGRPRGR